MLFYDHFQSVSISQPPALLGISEVPFLLSKQANNSFILYVNADRKREGIRFWNDLSMQMCIYVARKAEIKPTAFFKFHKCLADCLKVKDIEDLRALTEDLPLEFLAENTSDGSLATFVRPRLGRDLPEHLLCCLEYDINHIFRGQEWVGYEISEDHFVFAIVLYHINDDGKEEANIRRRYLIQVSDEEEDYKEVSALDLYKIIESSTDPDDAPIDSSGGDLVPYDARSAPVTMNQAKDSQTLLQLKRNICEELEVVWKLSESDRRKAIKRLYFKYHPDKAPLSEKDMYEGAFKFLTKQIDRLENGLGLENPGATSDSAPDTQPSKWQSYYRSWTSTSRWARARSGSGGIGGEARNGTYFANFQPTPNQNEAKRWLCQAEAEYCTVNILRERLHNETRIACSICFMAHQVVEKALKAAMYKLLGLDPQYLKNHSLKCHAKAIHSTVLYQQYTVDVDISRLHSIASLMERHYLSSRYPNMYSLPDSPVHRYSQDEAEEAAEAAIEVLKIIRIIVE